MSNVQHLEIQRGANVRIPPRSRVLLLAIAASWSTFAGAAEWVMAPGTGRLEFVASYTGSELPGTFGRFDVALDFAPDGRGSQRLEVAVDLGSADLGDADMNEAVASAAWFDVTRFATATFASGSIVMLAPGEYEAAGILDLKGVQCPVTVPFLWRDDGDQASMRGELTLNRLDFGIGAGTWAATDEVAADVRVRFEVKLRRPGS